MLWLYLVVGFYTLYLSDCMHSLGQECILHWTCRDHHSKVIMIEEVFTASYNFVRGSNEQDVRRYRRDNRNNSQWLFDTTPVANQTTSKLFSESGSFIFTEIASGTLISHTFIEKPVQMNCTSAVTIWCWLLNKLTNSQISVNCCQICSWAWSDKKGCKTAVNAASPAALILCSLHHVSMEHIWHLSLQCVQERRLKGEDLDKYWSFGRSY